jgi:nucleoside-diphosphate kinase
LDSDTDFDSDLNWARVPHTPDGWIPGRMPVDLPEAFCYTTEKISTERNSTMQHTLAIVKPDGVARGLVGEVIKRIEANGLTIRALKLIRMTKSQAQGFYAVHKERPFFDSLTSFMSSGPAVVMILEGPQAITKWREMMGATNFKEAAEGTIRREFATDIEKNVVHGSDAAETALFETGYFFNVFERVG